MACVPTCVLLCSRTVICSKDAGIRGLLHPEENPQVPPLGSSARSCNFHWHAVLLNRTHPSPRVQKMGRESSEAGQCLGRKKKNFQLPCSVISETNV